MMVLAKILTGWIPVKKWRRAARRAILEMIPLRNDWVVFYDTFSRNGNGDSIRPLAIELRKRHPKMKFFFVATQVKEIEMADEVLVLNSTRANDVLRRAKWLFSPMDLPREKKKNQIWVMLWHGSPIKKLYLSRARSEEFFKYVKTFKLANYFCYSSEIFLPIMCEAFDLPKEKFIPTGLPRNDVLTTQNKREYREEIKRKLGIPLDKKVLFYCPTWRRTDKKQPMPFDLRKLQENLSDSFVILLRSHVGRYDWVDTDGNAISLNDNLFAFDVGMYENCPVL